MLIISAYSDLKVVIPEEIDKEYNHALVQRKPGDNTLVGYHKQLDDLEAALYNPKPIALLLAREGSGKTALVDQFIYNRSITSNPLVVIQLNIEKLGELGSDMVPSRMRTLLSAAVKIREATQEANPDAHFQMALFIDEMHKLNNYGVASRGKKGSSGAMNALKDETADGRFPVIAATTPYEYEVNIKPDPAFARRFSIITIKEPNAQEMVEILQTRATRMREQGEFVPSINQKDTEDLISYANSYIYNQANPAKAIDIFNRCIASCRLAHARHPERGLTITHEVIRQAFLSLGIDIDKGLSGVKVVIPPRIDREYNHSITQMEPNNNTLVGYHKQLRDLNAALYNPDPVALLLAQEGSGKTTLIRQFIYNRSKTKRPVAVLQLNVEKLGELGSDLVVSRIRTLLSAAREIQKATKAANPNVDFQMVLFIDEMHKLNNYGVASRGKKGSSGAMNALKEETSNGKFPLIGATTKYEYIVNIKPDPAFARRFSLIEIKEPKPDVIVKIIKSKLKGFRDDGEFTPTISEWNAMDLVTYSNSYVYDQAQPAKAIYILNKCVGTCRMMHQDDPTQGLEITHEIIRQAFLSLKIDIDDQKDNVKLVIPPSLRKKYNYSLNQMPMGNNTLVGNEEQLEMLDANMLNIEEPSALLLGEAGIGKTALVEQWIYNRNHTKRKVAVVSLAIEKLGELDENVVIARMRDLLGDLRQIRQTTLEANPHLKFDMALFIDEIHKLNNYGPLSSDSEGSSAAMNALKEGLARGAFPLIGATTDYEYRSNIVGDLAFDRRFGKIAMMQPTLEQVVNILKRRLEVDNGKIQHKIHCNDEMFHQIVSYADSFIRNQANPAKSLAILDKCTGYCRRQYLNSDGTADPEITHEVIKKVFAAEGYAIDTTATPEHVEKVVNSHVIGQPLALHELAEVVRSTLYSKRNFDRPLMSCFFVGSTGVGKTETAKQLAKAFFGRRDAMIMINCGDYVTKESAIEAQHYIGDRVQINKQQLILLDEIEKADIAVMDTFMRMIDDGIVRDSHNIDRSINSTVVVATSNLGADIFAQLAENLHIHEQKDPNHLDPRLSDAWWRQEQSVRKALQNGDAGLNNGIKPEFLERFSLFVPFLPLAKKTIAMIAHRQIQDFIEDMKDAGQYSIHISAPEPFSHAKWQRLLGEKTQYGDDDPISVMIANDIIGPDAKTNGARSITRFINQQIKPAVIDVLDYRVKHHLPYNGVFKLGVENADFQSNNRERPRVTCTYED